MKKNKIQKKNKKKADKGYMPDAAYDVNGPDDAEIGDGITPDEILKRREKEDH